MAEHENLAYLVTRERQSRELAEESDDVAVRIAHETMADKYAERILAHQPLSRT
jgi:hypothetical protein